MIDLNTAYPKLAEVLAYDSTLGLHFKRNNGFLTQKKRKYVDGLKYYYFNESSHQIVRHNIEWAKGIHDKPKFQFLYLMLPTKCNQKCYGCFMGQDEIEIPENLKGSFFCENELSQLIDFALSHQVEAIVYGGGGELFTWNGAIDYIKHISNRGLRFVVFTNGVLLDEYKLRILNELKTSIIISLRDTQETTHNNLVGTNSFASALKSVDIALQLGFADDNRLAVEIPGTTDNEKRVIYDLLPALRYLGIIPMIEEFLQYGNENKRKCRSHNFKQSREFFEKLKCIDNNLGFQWEPELGTRILGQPKCQRPLYSFTVFPNREITDCPAGFKVFGNLLNKSLTDIIYSNAFKNQIRDFEFCACSVFYSKEDKEIPISLKEMYN